MPTYIDNLMGNAAQAAGAVSNALGGTRGTLRGMSFSKFISGGNAVAGITARNKIVNGMDDPSHLGFTFMVLPGYANTGLFGDENPPRDNVAVTDVGYSALYYLKKCVSHEITEIDTGFVTDEFGMRREAEPGEMITDKYIGLDPYGSPIFHDEYLNLRAFVGGMKDLTGDHPYVFQTIEGLQDAYRRYFANPVDSFLGGGEENRIKIGCLESMDLRMLALFDAYLNAVYSHRYRRQVLPPNLLKFDCGVLVHDIRNIAPGVWNDSSVLRITPELAELIAGNVSTVFFKFKDCVFDIEDIGEGFAGVGNAEVSETGFSFSIRYSDAEISVNSLADAISRMEGFDVNEGLDSSGLYGVEKARAGRRTSYIEGELSQSAGGGIRDLMDFGQKVFNSATSSSKFGNVYDDSVNGLVSNMLSAVTGASASTIINGLASRGRRWLGDTIMENLPSGPGRDFIGNMTNGLRF